MKYASGILDLSATAQLEAKVFADNNSFITDNRIEKTAVLQQKSNIAKKPVLSFSKNQNFKPVFFIGSLKN